METVPKQNKKEKEGYGNRPLLYNNHDFNDYRDTRILLHLRVVLAPLRNAQTVLRFYIRVSGSRSSSSRHFQSRRVISLDKRGNQEDHSHGVVEWTCIGFTIVGTF